MRRYGESKAHDEQKERIAKILRDRGWAASTEYPFEIPGHKYPYWADVYAQNFNIPYWAPARSNVLYPNRLSKGARRAILEIQGPKGHNTKLARTLDDLRIEDICNAYGDIEYFEVFLNKRNSPNDIRNWTTEDIAEELRL